MFQHKAMAAGGWIKLSLCEQMANIGSEVGRSISWREKGNVKYSMNTLYHALELIDLTIQAHIKRSGLGELTRLREYLVDYLAGDNLYNSTKEQWDKYFLAFNYCARCCK